MLEIFDISIYELAFGILGIKQFILVAFPFLSQILVCATGFCSLISLFILRFTFGELNCKNIKIKVGRDIDTSLLKYQDHQDY